MTPAPRIPPGRQQHVRAAVVIATTGAVMVLAAGCVSEDTAAPASDSCTAIVDRAADAAEISDQIALLDTALVVCRSYDSFDAHVSEYPSMLGYDVATFVELRCTSADDVDVRSSNICSTTAVPPAVPVEPTVPEEFYAGQTLDGREVIIRPDADTPFVDGKPATIVQIVDIAAEDGCDGVELEGERWAALVSDPAMGDEASVYAQHALNVAAFIDC